MKGCHQHLLHMSDLEQFWQQKDLPINIKDTTSKVSANITDNIPGKSSWDFSQSYFAFYFRSKWMLMGANQMKGEKREVLKDGKWLWGGEEIRREGTKW